MKKHSPTPWQRSDSFGANPHGICIKSASDELMIASCIGYYGRDGAIENAQFIVLACNSHDALVKALKEARSIVQYAASGMTHSQDMTNFAKRALAAVDAALTEAGAQP